MDKKLPHTLLAWLGFVSSFGKSFSMFVAWKDPTWTQPWIGCAIYLCCAFENLVHPIELNPWSSCKTYNTYCYLFLKIFLSHLVPFVMTLSCYPHTFCKNVSQAFSECLPNPWLENTHNQMSNISPHKNPTKLTKHHLIIVFPSHLSYFVEIDLVELW